MTKIQLGSTGIEIEKNGFGCLPIQRITKEDAARLLRKALDGGIITLTPPGPTPTARRSWAMPSQAYGTRW